MRFSVLNSDAERRDGLKALLRQIDRQARFNEAQDWRQVDRALRRQLPDLLIIDWQDWMSPMEIRRLLAEHPSLRVAVLTDDTSPKCVRNLLDKGVLGVVLRDTDPRLIVRALEIVLLGGHYVPAGALALPPPPQPEPAPRQPDVSTKPPPRRTRLASGLSLRQAADHALRAHEQHQQDDCPHARYQRGHRQDPSGQYLPATRRPQSGGCSGALQRLAVGPYRGAAQRP